MSFCDDLNMDSKGIITMVQNFEYLISNDSFVEDMTDFLKKASCGPIILECIAILTNCVPDPSLLTEAMPTKEDFKKLKTPSSFKGSISQVVSEAAQAYKTGNSEMYRIEQSLINVPNEFINVMRILTQEHENEDYKRSLNRILKKIDNCVTRCKICASNAYDSFYKVSETLNELHRATMASASFYEKQKMEAIKQKKILEDDHIAHKEMENSLKEEYEKAEKNANDARKNYWKQVKGWDVFLKILGLGGMDCAKDVAKMFISAEAEAISFSTDLAKYGFKKVMEELEKKKKATDAKLFKKQMDLAKLLEEIAISLNPNTSFTEANEYITLLNAFENVTFGTCEGIDLSINAKECHEFLKKNAETLAAEENKTKIEDLKVALTKVVKACIKVMEEKKAEKNKQKTAQRSLQEQIIISDKEKTLSISEQFKKESEIAENRRNELNKNAAELRKIIHGLQTVDIKTEDFTQYVTVLLSALNYIADAAKSWGNLAAFFDNIKTIVEINLYDNVSSFIDEAKIYNDVSKKLMIESLFKATKYCLQIINCSKIYTLTSQKHILPIIENIHYCFTLTPSQVQKKQIEFKARQDEIEYDVRKLIEDTNSEFDESAEIKMKEFTSKLAASIFPAITKQ